MRSLLCVVNLLIIVVWGVPIRGTGLIRRGLFLAKRGGHLLNQNKLAKHLWDTIRAMKTSIALINAPTADEEKAIREAVMQRDLIQLNNDAAILNEWRWLFKRKVFIPISSFHPSQGYSWIIILHETESRGQQQWFYISRKSGRRGLKGGGMRFLLPDDVNTIQVTHSEIACTIGDHVASLQYSVYRNKGQMLIAVDYQEDVIWFASDRAIKYPLLLGIARVIGPDST